MRWTVAQLYLQRDLTFSQQLARPLILEQVQRLSVLNFVTLYAEAVARPGSNTMLSTLSSRSLSREGSGSLNEAGTWAV